MSILLGAIADDFTGATDLANTLVCNGMRTVQVIGVPDTGIDPADAEAVVIALKSRSAPVDSAVADSLAALQWLRDNGARQIIFKYCSTFDSTASGNIGPVANALSDALATDFAIVCPAFPATGRTVYQGYLFVGDQLLSESPMKDHPLTPMRDANLLRLMELQSQRRCGLIPLAQVRAGVESIQQAIAALRARGYRYAVADAIEAVDLEVIGAALAGQPLVTGSSALAQALPRNLGVDGSVAESAPVDMASIQGRALVLAGSCSVATRRQIEAIPSGWARRRVDIDALAAGADLAGELGDWALAQDEALPVLIYASATPDEVEEVQQRHGVEASGAMVERLLGELARRLVMGGFNKLVVAGGETSGAVVSALGIRVLHIGSEIDTGVPWTQSLHGEPLALALKSGNFGGDDFFSKAFALLA